MKTFTENELREQLDRDGWTHEDVLEKAFRESITIEKTHYYGGELTETEIETYTDDMCRRSTLDGMSICYWNTAKYEEFEPDSLKFDNSSYLDSIWDFSGFQVVDEDGDVLSYSEVEDILDEYDSFKDIDPSELLEEINEVVQVDVDEESDMETIQIEVTNEPNIEFMGERIARVVKYFEFALYRTQAGRYICHKCDFGRMNEAYYYTAAIVDDHMGVIEFFGHGDLAKKLYCKAGIEDKTVVE